MAVHSANRDSNERRRLVLLVLRIACIVTGLASMAIAEDSVVAFTGQPNGFQIAVGGKPFARYVYGSEAIHRPYFESIHAPDGTQVTRNNPPVEGVDATDHPSFHPGLWLAFGDLSGADFWRNKDRIRHTGFVEEPRGGPGQGKFALCNQYEKGGQVIGKEVCRIAVEVRPFGWLLRWDSEIRPEVGELVFGDQEEMGLGIRLATPLAVAKGGRIVDSSGRINEAQVWGKQADWCAYERTIDDRRVGVVLMPHPENFRRSWFHARDYGLLAANPFGRNAFTRAEKSRIVVKKGETLRLRFGVLVYSDRPDVDAAYREYVMTN